MSQHFLDDFFTIFSIFLCFLVVQSVVKVAAGPGSPAKRTREANGKKEKEDEPPSKKKKPEVATPALRAVPKVITYGYVLHNFDGLSIGSLLTNAVRSQFGIGIDIKIKNRTGCCEFLPVTS